MTVKQDDGGTLKFPIQNVADNNEKYISYQENFKRYYNAKKSGFYLECLWILYAMMEDRTSAFLYHIGFTAEKKRTAPAGSKKIRKEIREILGIEDTTNIRYNFDSFGGKLSRIKQLLEWCNIKHDELSIYQQDLIKIIQPVADSSEFIETLDYLETEWRDKRNQLVHALFNKNTSVVMDELCRLVEDGYNAIRQLDAAVKKVKSKVKKQNIRLKFKIQ